MVTPDSTRSNGHAPDTTAERRFNLPPNHAEGAPCMLASEGCEGMWRYYEFAWRAHGCLVDD